MKQSDPLAEEAIKRANKRFARFGMFVLATYVFLIIYFIVSMTLWLSK